MSLQPSSGASKLDNKKESGGVAIALFSQSHFEKFTRIEADFSAVWCGLASAPVECAPGKSKEKSLATKKGNRLITADALIIYHVSSIPTSRCSFNLRKIILGYTAA